VRERFFTPRLRFKSYDELNAWLMDKCIAWTKAHGHPERPDQTIWEMFEEERPQLIPYRGRFDGFHALPASVSKTCLVRFDNNKYSVSASAVGRPVDIHAYAERVVIRQDGRIVAEHPRRYGRGATVHDPWHYAPVLARKPGALRNGAPFKDWVLPTAGPAQARRIWPSPSRGVASALDRSGASSPPSISSISSRPKVEPDARDASQTISLASTSSSSTNSAISRSPKPAANAIPSRQPALRTHLDRRHHQSRLRRMAERVRRPKDDHRTPRSSHPPLRHRRDRQ